MMNADSGESYRQTGIFGNGLHGIFGSIDGLLVISGLKLSLDQIGPDSRIVRGQPARLIEVHNCFPGLTRIEKSHSEGVARWTVLWVQTQGSLELLNASLDLVVL